MLGLTEPEPKEMIPAKASTAGLLAFAILCPGAEDPVEGMVNGTRAELAALALMLAEGPVANILDRRVRQLDVAMALLRRTDCRDTMPTDELDEPEEEQEAREEGERGNQPPKSGEIPSGPKPEGRS